MTIFTTGYSRCGAVPGTHFLVLPRDTRNPVGYNRLSPIPSERSTDLYAVVTVYDITDRESYGALAWWFAERCTHVPESTVKIIIGNKADKVCSSCAPSLPMLFWG